ncbi:hypothetical protein KIW84_034555 [Lathyrus oleraceus]|uniref:ATP-dependent DNA helicase n=1 Tax=Pisum sativum TaxID=3888 RepID=A0A9D4Y3S8_PEA|nr:hypothetical protein KIW84_034555 [Pisum sativum]
MIVVSKSALTVKKPGHTIEVCFKKHGLPPYMKKVDLANLITAEDDGTEQSQSHQQISSEGSSIGFAAEQQQALLALLHQSFTSLAHIVHHFNTYSETTLDNINFISSLSQTSWEYLLTNNGTTFNTFKKSVEDRGFLETYHSIHDCLVEATNLQMPYALWSYDLPSLPSNTIDGDAIPSLIQEELAVDIPNEDIESVAKLNNDQMIAFKTIMNIIVKKHNGVFFVDDPEGTAETLLLGGRTSHSRFRIPIDIQLSFICGIQKKKDLANLIRVAAAIIWDEAPITNKNCLEALDRSLQDICSNIALFGGKVMIIGGDFRQIFPVVRKGTKAQMISACIVQSHLWDHTKILILRQNMRSLHDEEFA